MAPPTVHVKQFFNSIKNYSGITFLYLKLIKQRPFMGLYLGVFLATGFFPMMAYLLFICAAVSLGVFLLAVVESVIIAMATITLLVFLIIPACIASGFSLLGCTLCVAVSQMKIFGSYSLNDPDKRFRGKDLKQTCDEKPSFEANIRFSA